MSRSRIALLAVAGALALLVVVSLVFVPRGGNDNATQGSLDSSTLATAQTAGLGRLTPAMRSEIRQVVDAGRSRALPRVVPGGSVSRAVVQDLVRCADFDGQRYCLGAGWTDRTPAQVQQRVLAGATTTARQAPGSNTGGLSPAAALARLAAMSPAARAREETQQLTMAARSVAKVWLLRHEFQGVPLPANFLQQHPEASASVASRRVVTKGAARRNVHYPRTAKIISRHWATSQNRTYWCGPTATQMIVAAWAHHFQGQGHWARRLHTTTNGTATSDIVRVINNRTGWGNARHAGPYIVLDISDWTFKEWYRLIAKHISVYHAPVVLNPILLKKFYPYLDHDESGHFQVGRGYSHPRGKTALLSYFEPWNPQRFDPSRPFIARVQWREALKSYEADEAHFAQDIGV